MKPLVTSSLVAVAFATGTAHAQPADAITELSEVMRLSEIIDIMEQEGRQSAIEVAVDFDVPDSARLQAALDDIYDVDRMHQTVKAGLSHVLTDEEAGLIVDFFDDGLGARILDLELSARIAFMDESIEAASNEFAATLPELDPERYALLTDYVTVNDLLESNVVGALNSNYAFMTGLADGGAFPDPLGQGELLNEVYAQEPEIRASTDEWLYSYLSLAYRPLSDEELQAYVDFSKTNHGQALNTALFAGFDAMFEEVSHALGLTVGQMSRAEEL